MKSTSSAPETLLKNELTSKSDIWSAGIVLLEVINIILNINSIYFNDKDGCRKSLGIKNRTFNDKRINYPQFKQKL